jgi:hypothetical protein
MSERIKEAKARYEAAAKALVEAVKEEYPVGSIVNVTIGRATFDVEIVGYSDCWWYYPEGLFGRNLFTGKLRKFHPNRINR